MMIAVFRSPWPPGRWVTAVAIILAMSAEAPIVASSTSSPSTQDGQTQDEPAVSQVDLRDVVARLFGRGGNGASSEPENESLGETRFFVFPTFGGNPAVGFAVGALANLTNFWGDPATTPLSSMIVSTSFTTERQVLLVARSDLYAPNDTWHLVGDWRFYRFNERTHGLGSDQPELPSAEVNYDWYRLHQTAYRPVGLGLEIGVGYHLDVHGNIRLADEQQTTPLPVPDTDSETTRSSGLSVNLVFDTRDHPISPDRGLLGRASYMFYRTGLGSDTDWDSLQLDGRAFQRLPGARRQTVALWATAWLTRAGEPPYFDLPSVGWDMYGRTARGYRAGRFRGRSWVYTELEYRTEVTRNGLIGVVGFLNASTLSDFETRDFQRWQPGGGLGLRVKLDKDRRSNVAIDFAWGREGSKGLYLSLNEAF